MLARIEVLLDRMNAFPGRGDIPGHCAKELHDFREVTIVFRDELVEDLVGLLELPLDLELLLLSLLVGLAAVQGFNHRDQEAGTRLWER